MSKRKELERSVLGMILSDNRVYWENYDLINHIKFTSGRSKIWDITRKLIEDGKEVDPIIIADEDENLEQESLECFGSRFIGNFTEQSRRLKNITIRDRYNLLCEWLRNQIDNKTDVVDLSNKLLDKVMEYTSMETKEVMEPIDQLELAVENIEKHKGKKLTGYSTGFHDVDEYTKGMRDTELTVLASRPGMGKTAYAICVAINLAKQGIPVCLAELEMSNIQLWTRMIVIESKKPYYAIQKGDASYDEAVNNLSKLPIYTVDDHFNLNEIEGFARKMNLTGRCKLLITDYLQLIEYDRGKNKEERIGNISRRFKILSKYLNIPSLLLSQLSRACEVRGGEMKPKLSDLRDSGSIEQDADVVQMLYRPEYYGFTETPDGRSTRGLCLNIINKNRHGKVGERPLYFIEDETRFENHGSYKHEPPEDSEPF